MILARPLASMSRIMKTEKIKKYRAPNNIEFNHEENKERKKGKKSTKQTNDRNQSRFGMSRSLSNAVSLPYRQAPWLNDRRPWTQSRSSSCVSPEPPAIKAETSSLNSGALPCGRAWGGRLRLPLVEIPRPRFRFESPRAGRGACEVFRRRILGVRVPGTQFSLSESPGSISKFVLPDLDNTDLDGFEGFVLALLSPVSNRPKDDTVRPSFRLFSPID